EHLALGADQMIQAVADDGDRGAVALDVHVDVAVEIGDVQQALQVVGRDVALFLEPGQAAFRLGLRSGFRLRRHGALRLRRHRSAPHSRATAWSAGSSWYGW